ncbi:MAG: NAD(P)-dependent oxidoreductase [Actinomycetota bacterium]
MKVAVFGAISSMGQEVVEDLVFRGHEVIACVPDVARIPSTWGTGVKVVAGPVTDTATVEAVVTGAQAVVNVLGPGRGQEVRGSPLVSGTRLIVAAMAAHGVFRYVGHGSPVVRMCPRDQPTLRIRWCRWLARCLRPRAYRVHRAMLEVVTNSQLDWTIVRFIRSRGGGSHGLRYVGFFGEDDIGCSASEVDIARFTAAQVMDTAYIDDAPAVSN